MDIVFYLDLKVLGGSHHMGILPPFLAPPLHSPLEVGALEVGPLESS